MMNALPQPRVDSRAFALFSSDDRKMDNLDNQSRAPSRTGGRSAVVIGHQ